LYDHNILGFKDFLNGIGDAWHAMINRPVTQESIDRAKDSSGWTGSVPDYVMQQYNYAEEKLNTVPSSTNRNNELGYGLHNAAK
jgi:hypothetical protein